MRQIVNCLLVMFTCATWLPAQDARQADPRKLVRLGVPVPSEGGDLANTLQVVPGANGEELYAVADRYFESLVFDGTRFTASQVRRQLNDELAARLKPVVTRCSLDESQKEKLQLAGRGDIKSWFDRVENLRLQVTAERLTGPALSVLVRQMSALNYERRNGLFGKGSLFRKTAMSTLSNEQIQEFAAIEREIQLDAIYQALRKMPREIGDFPISDETLRKIAQRVLDTCGDVTVSFPYAQEIYVLQAAELGDEVEPLLKSLQEWNTWQNQIAKARRAEARLRRLGVWPPKAATKDEDSPRPLPPPRR